MGRELQVPAHSLAQILRVLLRPPLHPLDEGLAAPTDIGALPGVRPVGDAQCPQPPWPSQVFPCLMLVRSY